MDGWDEMVLRKRTMRNQLTTTWTPQKKEARLGRRRACHSFFLSLFFLLLLCLVKAGKEAKASRGCLVAR